MKKRKVLGWNWSRVKPRKIKGAVRLSGSFERTGYHKTRKKALESLEFNRTQHLLKKGEKVILYRIVIEPEEIL